MKKYVKSTTNKRRYNDLYADMGIIVQNIHELTDFDRGELTTPEGFVEEVIPQIEALLDEAKSLVR